MLRVRRDAPVANSELLIELHQGNLKRADGIMVKEFGPVALSWLREEGTLSGEITLPGDQAATLALPFKADLKSILIDGKQVQGVVRGNRLCIPLASGKHTISY